MGRYLGATDVGDSFSVNYMGSNVLEDRIKLILMQRLAEE